MNGAFLTEAIGGVAAICTTLSFIPQAVKVIREKETHAISLTMYAIFTTGIVFWLIYGFALTSWPMIIANAITLVLAGAILTMKIRYG